MTELTKPLIAAAASQSLLDSKAAAAYLGLSEQTLASWRCTGRYALPFVLVGRRIKYRQSDLDRWISSRTVNAAGDGA